MLFVATMLATSPPCSPTDIAAGAIVSPSSQEDPAAVGLSQVDSGFWKPSVQDIAWSGRCTPKITRLYGSSTLVTASGLTLSTEGGSTLHVGHDPLPAPDPEPPHPDWKGHRFVASASLLSGSWRVAAWARRDGVTDIARYRPGDTTAPIILMSSARPLIGLSYLGMPDSAGGTLYFAQRLGRSAFRMVAINWSEGGLRGPGR